MTGKVLPRRFYNRSTIDVAKDLLGKELRHRNTSGIIVETEAYLGGEDLASHSARGLTDRTRVIFGPPGHAYVYLIYGMYECLNIVAEPDGIAGCVLIRAIEPLSGIEEMKQRRPAARSPRDIASGPGKLTLALGVTRALNGSDVTKGPLTLHEPHGPMDIVIETSPRVGITHCADWPLRFTVAGNPFVSRVPGSSPHRKP